MIDYGIKNKVALITGSAGAGLGRADALALAAWGAKIAVVDIADGSETVALIEKQGGVAKSYKCDISDATQTQNVVSQIEKDLGPVLILVNNASILTTVGMFADIPLEKWNRDIIVNTMGTANITRAVWPTMLKNKWGRIVMMSSIAGTDGGLGQTSYSASKASVIGLGKSLALEGSRSNITVNVIAPGVIETGAVGFIREDMLLRMKKACPMNRLGRPEEIGNTIAFLCSEHASFITGQVLAVDGGAGLFTF